jgi:DNA ligase (NAD+)
MNDVIKIAAAHNWNMPTVCPLCGTKLVLNENHTRLYCPNNGCKTYSISRFTKWTSVMDIKEIGKATIELISDNGFEIPDLYKNEKLYEFLLSQEGFGEKSVEKIKKNVNAHKEMTLAQFVAGFNIEDIGQKVIKKAIDVTGSKTIKDILNTSKSSFLTEGISEITAGKIFEGLQSLKDMMLETAKYVNIISDEGKTTPTDGKLNGMSFCFTGAMEYKRSDLEKMVVENGGTVGSVNKNLTYLVQQDPNSTSGKSVKAKSLGIKIISPSEFLNMIGR